MAHNLRGVGALYRYEMARAIRTIGQSLATPVITTCLYFVVFGAAMGKNLENQVGGSYAAFIVPGLMMLSVLTQSVSNAAFGIYLPKFTGTIYEILSAPLSSLETVTAYVGASATKAMVVGVTILATAWIFVDVHILHPFAMIAFMFATAFSFSLLGFIIGVWAKNFDSLQFVPSLVITPMTFLGGAFYSLDVLPDIWQKISLLNPVVYIISGFRWCFYGASEVSIGASVLVLALTACICVGLIVTIFRTGYKLRN